MSIRANLDYLVATNEKPIYYASQGGGAAQLSMEGLFETREVAVSDGRAAGCTLDVEGFALRDHTTAMADFYDDAQISNAYNAEVEQLVMAETGASRVVVFDHTRRSSSAAVREERTTREPSSVIHNDYSDASARVRVHDILPDQADDLLTRRFAIVNVWRPMKHPVEAAPLALCDARSLDPNDVVISERRARDRIGELLLVCYSPDQHWVYFPNMTRDEALLIKTYDSITDGRAQYAVHTAFDDPTARPDAPPRESIETRTFAFFD